TFALCEVDQRPPGFRPHFAPLPPDICQDRHFNGQRPEEEIQLAGPLTRPSVSPAVSGKTDAGTQGSRVLCGLPGSRVCGGPLLLTMAGPPRRRRAGLGKPTGDFAIPERGRLPAVLPICASKCCFGVNQTGGENLEVGNICVTKRVSNLQRFG